MQRGMRFLWDCSLDLGEGGGGNSGYPLPVLYMGRNVVEQPVIFWATGTILLLYGILHSTYSLSTL